MFEGRCRTLAATLQRSDHPPVTLDA